MSFGEYSKINSQRGLHNPCYYCKFFVQTYQDSIFSGFSHALDLHASFGEYIGDGRQSNGHFQIPDSAIFRIFYF